MTKIEEFLEKLKTDNSEYKNIIDAFSETISNNGFNISTFERKLEDE